METVGVHYIVDIFNLPTSILEDQGGLDRICKEAIELAGLVLLNVVSQKFEPQGATGLYLLSTSHLSYHTYPEYGRIYIDLFTCGKHDAAHASIQHILEQLGATEYRLKTVFR
jgi:S-adenosylmethionine decarboxylase